MQNTLISVEIKQIGKQEIQTCSARELHAFLEIKQDFSDWIKAQIERARLVENKDFSTLPEKRERQILIQYFLTIEASKHIAMMCGTDKGFEVRDYFIECEHRLKSENQLNELPPEQRALVQLMVDQARTNKQLAEHADKIKRIEAKQTAFEEGNKFFTIVGYLNYRGLDARPLAECAKLGKKATALSKEQGFLIDKVRDPRFGIVGSYHESILEQIFNSEIEGM